MQPNVHCVQNSVDDTPVHSRAGMLTSYGAVSSPSGPYRTAIAFTVAADLCKHPATSEPHEIKTSPQSILQARVRASHSAVSLSLSPPRGAEATNHVQRMVAVNGISSCSCCCCEPATCGCCDAIDSQNGLIPRVRKNGHACEMATCGTCEMIRDFAMCGRRAGVPVSMTRCRPT